MLLEQFGECLRAWERDSKPERCIKCSYLSKTDGKTEIVTPRAPEVHCFHVTISLRLRAADVQSPQVWAGGEMSGHETCQRPPVLLRDAQWPRPLLKTVIIILGPITGQGYCPLPSQSFSLSKIQLSVFCEEPVPRDNLAKNVLILFETYWFQFQSTSENFLDFLSPEGLSGVEFMLLSFWILFTNLLITSWCWWSPEDEEESLKVGKNLLDSKFWLKSPSK